MIKIPYDVLNKDIHKRKGMFFLPFVIDHYDQMDVRQPELLAVARGYELRQMIAGQADMGTAMTTFLHGKPIAVTGVVYFWNGVGELWSLFDEDARTKTSTMLRTGKSYCDIAVRYLHLHRLQITVRTDDNRAINYARHLGFNTEATLKEYGPDRVDYLLMTRF
jgi:RimJ/RimL family protein N-acetyltransferase